MVKIENHIRNWLFMGINGEQRFCNTEDQTFDNILWNLDSY